MDKLLEIHTAVRYFGALKMVNRPLGRGQEDLLLVGGCTLLAGCPISRQGRRVVEVLEGVLLLDSGVF